VSSNFSFSYSL